MAVKDYSTTASSNTTISGINIDEGCAPGNINNAIRQAMADTAAELSATSTVASAATVDLSAQNGSVSITGTTTIISFGTATAGLFRRVTFTGSLTLTYNATSLILPTGTSITTAAGDTMLAESLGSGNWRVTNYVRASGNQLTSLLDNGIINPCFDFWQRGTSLTFGAGGGYQYLADKWVSYHTGAATFTRSTDVPIGFLYSMDITNGSILQNIESYIARNYAGKNITITVCAKRISGSGNFDVTLRYASAIDNFASVPLIGTVTLTSSLSNSAFTEYTATFNSLTTNVANGLRVHLIATGQYRIAWVKIEEGSGTPGFRSRNPALELTLCQRYYEKSYDLDTVPATSTDNGLVGGTILSYNGANHRVQTPHIRFRISKRTTPTLSFWNRSGTASQFSHFVDGAWSNIASAPTVQTSSAAGFTLYTTSADTLWVHFTADAEL